TSSTDGWVQLWDLNTRREIARTLATDGAVYNMEYSSDGAWLATSAVDRVGRLYEVSGNELRLLSTFRDAGTLAIAPDKTRVLARYFSLRLYDPRTYVETPTANPGLKFADISRVLCRKTPAMVLSGRKVYEMDPASGASRELTWVPGKPLLL